MRDHVYMECVLSVSQNDWQVQKYRSASTKEGGSLKLRPQLGGTRNLKHRVCMNSN